MASPRTTDGRCWQCNIVWRWPTTAGARLKDCLACPSCGKMLLRTAASALGGRIPIKEIGTAPAQRAVA